MDSNAEIKLYMSLAEMGDAAAQNCLGVIYQNGQGVSQDNNEAVQWFQMAAGQGYAPAQNNLGLIF